MQQPNTINYGATGHVANNPFAMSGMGSLATTTITEETMQPDVSSTTDNYGTYDYTANLQQQPGTAPQMGQLPTYQQQYPQYQQQQQPQ